jgi:hypothetical protein
LRIELAHLLAGPLADVSTAIGRLREIEDRSPRAPLARTLEGVFRLRLGEDGSAVWAFQRAFELLEKCGVPGEHPDARVIAEHFVGAAKVLESRGDRLFALRLARASFGIAPDPIVARLVHDLEASSQSRSYAPMPTKQSEESTSTSDFPGDFDPNELDDSELEGSQMPVSPMFADDNLESSSPELEARAEKLLASFKERPEDDKIVDELTEVLTSLGRDIELFALLSSRFEEATDEQKQAWYPRQVELLDRLARACSAAGRQVEARLYEQAKLQLLSAFEKPAT